MPKHVKTIEDFYEMAVALGMILPDQSNGESYSSEGAIGLAYVVTDPEMVAAAQHAADRLVVHEAKIAALGGGEVAARGEAP